MKKLIEQIQELTFEYADKDDTYLEDFLSDLFYFLKRFMVLK